MLDNNTKYRNAHFSESDESFIDCEFKDEVTKEWLPTSIPIDLSDPINSELGKKILKEVSKTDLKKVVRNGKLVTKPNSEIIAEAKAAIESARKQALYNLESKAGELISGGFSSEATGSPKFYGSSEVDQRNLLTSLLTGSDAYINCSDSSNSWSRLLHTPDEIKGVLKSFEDFKYHILNKLDSLRSKVKKAKTVATIEKVVWK